MKFVIASHNKKKIAELNAILSELGIEVTPLPADAPEPAEDGDTFEENALIKARSACAATGLPAVADDSGLCVDALGGAPGVYSARYGSAAYAAFTARKGLPNLPDALPDTADDLERCKRLLRETAPVPDGKRGAQFVSAVACVFPNGDEIVVRGACEGELTRSMQGEGGFGYDPLFYVALHGCTFGELPQEVKNHISHRARALQKLKKSLGDYYAEQ